MVELTGSRWEDAPLGLEGYDWFDPHVHILPPRRMRGLIRWVKGFFPHFPLPEDHGREEILRGMRKAGVKRFFNLVFPLWVEETADLNRFNFELCSEISGAVPFGSLHLDSPDKEGETARCLHEYGFAGMKLHPFAQGFSAFHEEMRPMYEVLQDAGRPLLVHTGFEDFYGMNIPLKDLERHLSRYDRVRLVAVHGLFPRFDIALGLLEEYPNFWVDLTNSLSCMRIHYEMKGGTQVGDEVQGMDPRQVEKYERHFEKLLEDDSNRVMYGSDYPVGFGSHRSLLEDLRWFRFGEEVERRLIHDSVLSLLSESGVAVPEVSTAEGGEELGVAEA